MTTQSLADGERDDRPPPIPSQTDVVVGGIKSMIIRGRLGPGARLPREKDLALELNVSRGPLREGVRALCLMGVLETRQGDGTYVTSLDASLLLAPMAFLVDLGTEADTFHLHKWSPCSPRPALIISARSSRPISRSIVSLLTGPKIRR
jgi:DNA-binding transcriptional MocR family regulator